MNLKQFAKIEATEAHGGNYFLLKSGKLIGGFSHRHILEKLFAIEISSPVEQRKYLELFQKRECAIRVVFEEHKRVAVHVINCASRAQAKAISILQRRASRKVSKKNSVSRGRKNSKGKKM